MDPFIRSAAEHKPIDYIRVRSGKILPDDLVWSPYTNEYMRHDDQRWASNKAEYVGQACYVIRRGKAKEKPEIVEDLERENLMPAQQSSLW